MKFGLKVNIETPSTQSMLPSLEKAEFTDSLNQATMIKQMFPDTNIGDGQERWDRFQKIRGFDINSYTIKSKQQIMREKQTKMLEAINNFDVAPVADNPP